MRTNHPFSKVKVGSLSFAAVTELQATNFIVDNAAQGRGGWCVTPNLDILRQCDRDPNLSRVVDSAELVVADGMPLIWASRLQGDRLPVRVAGSNLVEKLAQACVSKKLRVFLLGGDEGVAEQARESLQARYPGLQVVGTYCPPFGFEKNPAVYAHMRQELTRAAPNLVFVGLGFPRQEKLIQAMRSVCPAAWWLGIGISLSFSAGHVRRAPTWMQRSGLEWIHRLVQEPRRLARRYLVDGLPFAARLLFGSVLKRARLNLGS